MNAKQFISRMQKMAAEDDFTDLSSCNPRFVSSNCDIGGSIGGNITTAVGGNLDGCGNIIWTDNTTSGTNPWQIGGTTPYIGDPIFPVSPSYPPQPNVWPALTPQAPINVFSTTSSPYGDLFMEFFNIQRLQVEATCAVTGEKITIGEPVFILEEHVISKKAFMKMLMKQFARMMVPEIEEMAEIYDYDK